MSSRRFDRLLNCCGLALLLGVAAGGTAVLLAPGSALRPRVARAGDPPAAATASTAATPLDPAAWGEDHVGQPVPEFVESGECLFCHRGSVGGDWQRNRHALTIHDVAPDGAELKPLVAAHAEAAAQVRLLLGHSRSVRYLRKSEKYGHLDLLNVGAAGTRGGRFKLTGDAEPVWQPEHFNQRCAGCHSLAVDPETAAFAAPSLDCFACHGDATEEHANEPALMPLAKARRDPPRVVVSICAQCHVRHGHSRSTGRPYATNFVAGDNLFKDFEVDWSAADDPALNTIDRHVLENVRDVVLWGREELTCVSCHTVHKSDDSRHRELPRTTSCQVCHEPDKPLTEFLRSEVHSPLCEY